MANDLAKGQEAKGIKDHMQGNVRWRHMVDMWEWAEHEDYFFYFIKKLS